MSTVAKKETTAKKAPAKKAAKTATKGTAADGRHYDVIVRPLVTEKTTRHAEQNKIVFEISPTATKKDVKSAVEAIFSVEVTKVNTILVEGKQKRFRGRPGQRSDLRKAIVTLANGQSIDLAAGAR